MDPLEHRARRASRDAAAEDALRITAQFRTREGMAYELREHGERLTVLITAAADASMPWRVEAFATGRPDANVQHAALTRREALRLTGAEWRRDAGARTLPSFDWDAIALALGSVRAI
jgi:hypothetical protein